MKLHFFGACRQVTGSCYLLETRSRRVLVDCGLYQEREFQPRNWKPLPVDAASLDAVVLTHAHLDHCGRLPRLEREGFRGVVHCTEPTLDLVRLLLLDSARLQREDVETKRRRHQREGRTSPHPYEPLYEVEDVESVLARVRTHRYEQPVVLGSGITLRFRDAGHILGSALLEFDLREDGVTRRVVFSGDLGQPDLPIVCEPTRVERADHVVIESTYGDREHLREQEVEEQLAAAIRETFAAGGKLVIPTFAIERAQQLMLHLAHLRQRDALPHFEVLLDSPMAIDVTEVYRHHLDWMDAETRAALDGGELRRAWSAVRMLRTVEQSKRVQQMGGNQIVLAGSGMCTGGRIKHHLRHNIERPESTILFAGYQAEGTLGRLILDGAAEVRILGRVQPVRARVRQIHGLSAHAGRSDLLAWLRGFHAAPRRVFVTHGEEQSALALARSIEAGPGHRVETPRYADVVDLAAD